MSKKILTEEQLIKNRGYRRKWYYKHRSTILEKCKKYKREHKDDPDYKCRKKKYRERSRDKDIRRTIIWRSNNIDKIESWKIRYKDRKYDKYYKVKYNLTLIEYNKLLEEQNGVCLICGGINKNNRRLTVDHNHVTGDVRGLLCTRCNSALGWYEKYKDNAIKYLNHA